MTFEKIGTYTAGGDVEGALGIANTSVEQALSLLGAPTRVDFAAVPDPALALLVAEVVHETDTPLLALVDSPQRARSLANSIRSFLGTLGSTQQPAVFTAMDVSPYLMVAPDRRAAMDRLSLLSKLAGGTRPPLIVTSVAAFMRATPATRAVREGTIELALTDIIERDALASTFASAGYLRVPVAEDPGTFAVRGSLVDIFPANHSQPFRIELDDTLVASLHAIDPVSQRRVFDVDALTVAPATRIMGTREPSAVVGSVREQCDILNMPSSKARALSDDILAGRQFYGVDGFLPAFSERRYSLLDYLPNGYRPLVVDPAACAQVFERAQARAHLDYQAAMQSSRPAYPPEAHYVQADELARCFEQAACVHRVALHGAVEEPLAALQTLSGQTHRLAVDSIAVSPPGDPRGDAGSHLEMAIRRIRALRDEGMSVLIATRSTVQAERVVSLLKTQGFNANHDPNWGYDRRRAASDVITVVAAEITGGFSFPGHGLALLGEELLFGRQAARRAKKKSSTVAGKRLLEDLRELRVGDYVVHLEHGIGRYLGLERRRLGESRSDRMRGITAPDIELLVVEYAGGDKLFLPVTRLNQIQKYASQDAQKPRLDRLGGQSFAKTRSRVRKQVRHLADDLLRLYAERRASERDPVPSNDQELAVFEAAFPFDETEDQAKAIDAVMEDLDQRIPMDRVVCGDVGFGKTEVALRAAFRVAMSGRQVALLCPTTVLAQQHFNTFRARFSGFPLKVRSLSRFVTRESQRQVLAGVKDGTVDVVVGTHRLLSKDVHFSNLGLLVVDEEQRFGVTHKERIKTLRKRVDVLTLSATPIPRTLQMAIGGLRELSLITTAPVDRRAVRTFVARVDDEMIREAIVRETNRGGQVFFVYNRIEGLYERAQRLQELLPETRIAVAHGQMNEGALETVMTEFVDGAYDVLCSTAIIESGLDIPRANTMIVDRADMFGLAQLYQLRGRVGRSRERAYCYLLTPPPQKLTEEAKTRIEALERFTALGSGFHIASLDMEMRGAGDLLGAEQSGSVSAVGIDLFLQMLQEAVAELRGTTPPDDFDTELSFDIEMFLPEDYIEDVGVRLSCYKRLASAATADEVMDIGEELEERFGPPPLPARQLVRAMAIKPDLRRYRALGLEATKRRVTLHLKADTPLDPQKVMAKVTSSDGAYTLSPDMKLTRRFQEHSGDAIDRARELLGELAAIS